MNHDARTQWDSHTGTVTRAQPGRRGPGRSGRALGTASGSEWQRPAARMFKLFGCRRRLADSAEATPLCTAADQASSSSHDSAGGQSEGPEALARLGARVRRLPGGHRATVAQHRSLLPGGNWQWQPSSHYHDAMMMATSRYESCRLARTPATAGGAGGRARRFNHGYYKNSESPFKFKCQLRTRDSIQ